MQIFKTATVSEASGTYVTLVSAPTGGSNKGVRIYGLTFDAGTATVEVAIRGASGTDDVTVFSKSTPGVGTDYAANGQIKPGSFTENESLNKFILIGAGSTLKVRRGGASGTIKAVALYTEITT